MTKDEIRDAIMNYLYEQRSKARGVAGLSKKFKDIQKGVQSMNIKQGELADNLQYLVSNKWVEQHYNNQSQWREGYQRTIYYSLSPQGIDMLVGRPSKYSIQEHYKYINIEKIEGLTVIANGIYVNVDYRDFANKVLGLLEEINSSSELSDADKSNLTNDLSTIILQTSKSEGVDGSIIKRAWDDFQNKLIEKGFDTVFSGSLIGIAALVKNLFT